MGLLNVRSPDTYVKVPESLNMEIGENNGGVARVASKLSYTVIFRAGS
jgi:hypothetical protein